MGENLKQPGWIRALVSRTKTRAAERTERAPCLRYGSHEKRHRDHRHCARRVVIMARPLGLLTMKLLAVSLVAAASASSNYTAVYGVQPRREHAPRRRDRRPHALRPREVVRGLAGLHLLQPDHALAPLRARDERVELLLQRSRRVPAPRRRPFDPRRVRPARAARQETTGAGISRGLAPRASAEACGGGVSEIAEG